MPPMSQHKRFLGVLVHEVAHMMRVSIDRRLKDHGLTRVQWLALTHIQSRPRLTQTELARELKLGAATTGRLVDRLQSSGLVSRLADPDDRRALRLVITGKAVSTLERLDMFPNELHQDFLGQLDEDELASLRNGLTKLRNSLRNNLSLAPFGLAAFETFEGLHAFALLTVVT